MGKLILLLLLLIPFSTTAKDYGPGFFEFTYYAHSKHITSGRYNSDHNLLGIEYRNEKHGVGISKFKNSYFDTSVLIDYARYWKISENFETSLRVGYVTGYNSVNKGVIFGMAYTKYDKFRPKISLFGGAVVLSVSIKF